MSKQKNGDGTPSAASQMSLQDDTDLSIAQMQEQFYQGYPQWRKCCYQEQKQLLEKLADEAQWKEFEAVDQVSNYFLHN